MEGAERRCKFLLGLLFTGLLITGLLFTGLLFTGPLFTGLLFTVVMRLTSNVGDSGAQPRAGSHSCRHMSLPVYVVSHSCCGGRQG